MPNLCIKPTFRALWVLFDVYWQTLKGWSLTKNKVEGGRRGKMNLNSGGSWIDDTEWIWRGGIVISVSNSTQQWDWVWEKVRGWLSRGRIVSLVKGVFEEFFSQRSKNAGNGVHQYIGLFPPITHEQNLSLRMFIQICSWIL